MNTRMTQQAEEVKAAPKEQSDKPLLDGAMLETFSKRVRDVFVRCPENPILGPRDMPFPCKAVCNPGAHLVDGETLLLLRVIDMDDHSHLYVARSADGVRDWRIEPEPLLTPNKDAGWYDDMGCEDPRITYVEERGEYIITYVGLSRYGAGVCLATTRDFKTAKRLGMTIHPYNKDAVVFPRRINGQYQMLHRPTSGPLENIWLSESSDLVAWGNPQCVLEESDQPGWDSGKVGAGPPPLEMQIGWLLIFHGVKQVEHGWEYRFGLAVLDKDQPGKVLGRWPDWVFEPQEPYEYNEAGTGIVFPTGLVITDEHLYVYYGAGDTCIGLATAERALLRSFREDSQFVV